MPVVSLRGQEIRPPGEPVEETIKLAEKLLGMARSGEISGLVAVCTHHDECCSIMRSTRVTFRLIGALQLTVVEFCNMQINEE